MSVLVLAPQKLDGMTWRLTWSSDLDDPVFRIYQDGKLIEETSATFRDFSVSPGESLVVEIIDDERAPEKAYPSRFTLGWRPSEGAASYRIDRQQEGAWTEKGTVADTGEGFYSWQSEFLEDCETHIFRIVPIGTNGNEGTPVVISCLMVRHPSPPNQNFSYNQDTREVTINA